MTGLPCGYTPGDVGRLARQAARARPMRVLVDDDEAADVAAAAIVEALYTPGSCPSERDLTGAALTALAAAAYAQARYAGLDVNRSRHPGRSGPPPGFARYWHGSHTRSGFEDDLTDRLAVRQVWAALSPRHRVVLAALAATEGDHQQAAAQLGITVRGWEHRLSKARAAARLLWFHPDPPARMWHPKGRLSQRLRDRRREAA